MAERFTGRRGEFNYLYVPDSGVGKRACCNLGYQMQHSVEALEQQLSDEGNPHVLQLNAFSSEGDWKNPDRWHLYADGREVASGDGEYARDCFRESSTAFLDLCREVVERAELPHLDEREYRLLACARSIASRESFDDGSRVMGAREGGA